MKTQLKEIKIHLKNNLKFYGLNPKEWALKKNHKNIYKIINLKDKNFTLLGEITSQDSQNLTWKSITLFQL